MGVLKDYVWSMPVLPHVWHVMQRMEEIFLIAFKQVLHEKRICDEKLKLPPAKPGVYFC